MTGANGSTWFKRTGILVALAILLAGSQAVAQDVQPGAVAIEQVSAAAENAAEAAIDTGDTSWVLISAALVMLMTPGLAFFYGGLVRKKNILSVLMQCFMVLAIISLQWVLFGYSLSFAPGNSFIGGLDWTLDNIMTLPPNGLASTIPHPLFMVFQMMFAVITPALIIGSFAERMRFSAFCVFSVLWATLVYDPVCHWVWGGGFLGAGGIFGDDKWALDFAGGTVVHINAGMAALAAALVLGKRKGFNLQISPPHNLPFAVLGAALLWFGWFGFNAGSAVGANGLAASAFVATHIATAAAGLVWCLLDWFKHGRPTTLGMITGAVAGLVAITPAAGFVLPSGAICIGILAGVVCWMSVTYMKTKLGYDDSLDAFGVHGVGGIVGALATGLFATTAANSFGLNGLFYGDPGQLWRQFVATGITAGYSFIVSFVILKVIDLFHKLRVTDHEERVGLDLTQHKESAYTVID